MIFDLITSFCAGIALPTLNNMHKQRTIKIKGRHIHHSATGFATTLGSLPFLVKGIAFGHYALGFGLGLITHHWFSEKSLKMITKD